MVVFRSGGLSCTTSMQTGYCRYSYPRRFTRQSSRACPPSSRRSFSFVIVESGDCQLLAGLAAGPLFGGAVRVAGWRLRTGVWAGPWAFYAFAAGWSRRRPRWASRPVAWSWWAGGPSGTRLSSLRGRPGSSGPVMALCVRVLALRCHGPRPGRACPGPRSRLPGRIPEHGSSRRAPGGQVCRVRPGSSFLSCRSSRPPLVWHGHPPGVALLRWLSYMAAMRPSWRGCPRPGSTV